MKIPKKQGKDNQAKKVEIDVSSAKIISSR
jgi:hypothetical protein